MQKIDNKYIFTIECPECFTILQIVKRAKAYKCNECNAIFKMKIKKEDLN